MRSAKAQEWEAGLTPEQLDVWRAVSAKLNAPTDYGLELYLLQAIMGGAKEADLVRYIPKQFHRSGQDRRQHLDRRELAAGER